MDPDNPLAPFWHQVRCKSGVQIRHGNLINQPRIEGPLMRTREHGCIVERQTAHRRQNQIRASRPLDAIAIFRLERPEAAGLCETRPDEPQRREAQHRSLLQNPYREPPALGSAGKSDGEQVSGRRKRQRFPRKFWKFRGTSLGSRPPSLHARSHPPRRTVFGSARGRST